MNNLIQFIDGPQAINHNGYNFYTCKDFNILDLPQKELLIAPWLSERSVSMVYAQRGVGKTFFALNIAFAIATGSSFLGWQASKPRSVLYFDGEMGAQDLQARCRAMAKAHGIAPEENLLIFTPDQQDVRCPDLSNVEDQNKLMQLCSEFDLIIIDNIATLCRSGSENETAGWRPVQQFALNLRRLGVSVLFVHHSGKSGKQRGSSAREDIMDTVIELRRPGDYQAEQGARFEVHFSKHRNFFGDDARSFEAALCFDDEGRPTWNMTTCEQEVTYHYRVAELYNAGLRQVDIARKMGKSAGSVSNWMKTARVNGLIDETKHEAARTAIVDTHADNTDTGKMLVPPGLPWPEEAVAVS